MELYLDSVNPEEIRAAADWGLLAGVTTTPTFMHRHGITDVDGAIVDLSQYVPLLHIEALGNTAADIVAEAERQLKLPMKCTPVFKIPVSNEGLKACRILTDRGHLVNVHLVYTLNQAYMAMNAGATYICPLAGRMHDQGQDAMALYADCVQAIDRYGYNSKVMVSSVRHAEHVRMAIKVGAHAVTAPWGVMRALCSNVLTDLGTSQFEEHTRLMTQTVRTILSDKNPQVGLQVTIQDALLQMTESGIGAVAVMDGQTLKGIFTDGDVRRQLREKGKAVLDASMGDFPYKSPITVSADSLLYEAVNTFKQHKVDNLIVLDGNRVSGILDIQDFVREGLIGG
jgi:transaldolase